MIADLKTAPKAVYDEMYGDRADAGGLSVLSEIRAMIAVLEERVAILERKVAGDGISKCFCHHPEKCGEDGYCRKHVG